MTILLVNLCHKFEDKIAYYQGMNYIVAFLMTLFDNKEIILRLSCTLVKTIIAEYVTTRLDGLKRGFYILNRLLQIYYPNLHTRLRTERVTVDVFSAPWFLTCYSLAAQHDRNSQNLRKTWDLLLSVLFSIL